MAGKPSAAVESAHRPAANYGEAVDDSRENAMSRKRAEMRALALAAVVLVAGSTAASGAAPVRVPSPPPAAVSAIPFTPGAVARVMGRAAVCPFPGGDC